MGTGRTALATLLSAALALTAPAIAAAASTTAGGASAIDNPTAGQHFAFYPGADDQIHAWNKGANAPWTNVALGTGQGVAPGTSPTALYDSTPYVYYAGTDAQVHQWSFTGSAWEEVQLGAGQPIAGGSSPSALVDPQTGVQRVFYAGADGQIWSWNVGPGGALSDGALGAGEPIRSGTSPAAVVNPYGTEDTQESGVAYVGADGQMWLWYSSGSQWINGPLGAGEAAAPGASPSAVYDAADTMESEFYEGADGALWVWTWTPSTGWVNTRLGGTAMADQTTPAAILDAALDAPIAYYAGADGNLWGWFHVAGQWSSGQVGTTSPKVAPGTSPTAAYDSQAHTVSLYWIGTDGQLHLMFYDGTQWSAPALGLGAAVLGFAAPAGPAPPTTRPLPKPKPPTRATVISPRRRAGHVHVKFTIAWHWSRAGTRIRRILLPPLPRHTTIRVRCEGARCHGRHWTARSGHLRGLRRLNGARFQPGQRVVVVVARPGLKPERIVLHIRRNHVPRVGSHERGGPHGSGQDQVTVAELVPQVAVRDRL